MDQFSAVRAVDKVLFSSLFFHTGSFQKLFYRKDNIEIANNMKFYSAKSDLI